MFQAFRDEAQGEGLDADDGLLAALPVRQNARELGNLGNPATVFLTLDLDGETMGTTERNHDTAKGFGV